MVLVIKLSFLPTGGLCIRPSCGGSVASASAPKVSIMRFTQSSCTAVRGADPEERVKENPFYVAVTWTLSSRLRGKRGCRMAKGTRGTSRYEVDHESDNVNSQLELNKFLNIDVH